MAKFAYDKGWYDAKKRVKISEMADELGIARATLAEHLSRIECIVMDDLFGSFSNFTITGADYDIIRQMVESDIESMGFTEMILSHCCYKTCKQIWKTRNIQ